MAAFSYELTPTVRSTGGKPPASGPRKGTINLAGVIVDSYPSLRSGGIYNPRPMNTARGEGSRWSHHANGSAVDIMVTVDLEKYPDGDPIGWDLARKLVAAHQKLGIQQVIYAKKIWSIRRDPPGWRNLSKRALNHLDHLHIEQVTAAADNLTRETVAAALRVPLLNPFTYQQPGTSGPWVAEARWWLKMEPGDVYDDAMMTRLRRAQQECEIQVDGILGPDSWECLKRDPSGAVEYVYRTAGGRAPDPGGHVYWTNLLRDDKILLSNLAGLLVKEKLERPPKPEPPAPPPPEEVVKPDPPSGGNSQQIRAALKACVDETLDQLDVVPNNRRVI